MDTFPRARRSSRGYDVDEVEDFLGLARRVYDGGALEGESLTASGIRAHAFTLRLHGYATGAVDAALERLESAFSARERSTAVAEAGDEEAWFARARADADEVIARLKRDPGRRFDRVGALSRGYRVADVDAFGDRLVRFFEVGDGPSTGVADVRGAAFAPQRGGYREAQVDALLAVVVDVMLAVR